MFHVFLVARSFVRVFHPRVLNRGFPSLRACLEGWARYFPKSQSIYDNSHFASLVASLTASHVEKDLGLFLRLQANIEGRARNFSSPKGAQNFFIWRLAPSKPVHSKKEELGIFLNSQNLYVEEELRIFVSPWAQKNSVFSPFNYVEIINDRSTPLGRTQVYSLSASISHNQIFEGIFEVPSKFPRIWRYQGVGDRVYNSGQGSQKFSRIWRHWRMKGRGVYSPILNTGRGFKIPLLSMGRGFTT